MIPYSIDISGVSELQFRPCHSLPTITDVDSDDEPEGIETYSLPKAIGWGCKNGNVTTFEGMVVDEVVTGIEEGCALWWEEEQCQGERHNFSFLLSSRSLTVPSACVLILTRSGEHVSNVLFDHEYRKGARSYSYTQVSVVLSLRVVSLLMEGTMRRNTMMPSNLSTFSTLF